MKSLSERKLTIVAIDDESVMLNIIVESLKDKYNIIPFVSGKDGLGFFHANTADLILLDMHMPNLSGLEVMRILRHNDKTSNIPIIFLTGDTDDEGEVAALQSGAVDYITKPIRPHALITRIELHMELENHRRNLEKLVDEKTADLNDAYNKIRAREDTTLDLLARVTEMRDSETGMHILRTTEFVRIIIDDLAENPVEGYKVSKTEAADIIRSTKLHDLGKIAISDNVLLKPGRLTAEEFDIIKTHPVHSEKLFTDHLDLDGNDDFFKTARDIAYMHHEKWNGMGYPLGLKGTDIPLSARVAAIADVYDALTSVRPYKKAFTHEEATKIISDDSGKHFDPYLVEVFLRHGDKFRKVAEQFSEDK